MDAAINVMAWVRLVLLILAAGYGIRAMNILMRSRRHQAIFKIKRKVFVMLAGGILLFALGILILEITTLLGRATFPSAADIPIALSHLLFITGFVYFWIKSSKLHKLELKETVFFFAVVCAVLLWLVFLFKTSVIPGSAGSYWFEKALYWYYPIAAALMFLSTLIINPRLKAEVITTPLWYLSTAIFLHFIAFNMHYYTFWNPISYYVPSIYALIYVLSAGFFVIGFYTAAKKYGPTRKRHK